MENEGRGAENRSRRRLARETWSALAILALGLTILGADKSPATRALQRFLSRGRTDAVTSADVLRGYRLAGMGDGGLVDTPANAVTNDLLRRRGGHDWAFRVEPDNWRSAWKGGVLTGVTVFARGEVRPDVGTLYYPVPVTNGVSLLPEARRGLLPNGGASVFSHAVTTNGSLLLDWRNAAVGRDANSPTNLQMEIFSDGSFVWRMDGGSTSYLPVLPFDWDGDGFENSVDPEPLAPNPVDAHGTSAEWYRVVCSNVFETAGGDLGWKEGVNSNAYYFVDVVAEEGPAPIWFNADRDSRLGSPVVVAWGGETNRVPLLIGIEYSVTSTVPFSVTPPEGGFSVATSNNECSVTVKWPLEFSVSTSDEGRTVIVTPVPYDPGGAFEWYWFDGSPRVARLLSTGPSACSYVANGGGVSWDCGTDSCGCRGCSISGNYTLEEVALNLPTIWCGCWDDDSEEPEPTPEPHTDMASRPSVTVAFSEPVVLFEDAYTNAPGEVVQRQSTTTTLTIAAYGGANGAYLTVDSGELENKLIRIGGHNLPTSRVKIPPHADVQYEITYEGKKESGGKDDIQVIAMLLAINAVSPPSTTAKATSVRVEFEVENPAPDAPDCRNRHRFGVLERVRRNSYPRGLQVNWPTVPVLDYNYDTDDHFYCPLDAKELLMTATLGRVELPISLVVESPRVVCNGARWSGEDGAFGTSGAVGMHLFYNVTPRTVSFEGLHMEEIPVQGPPGRDLVSGYFETVETQLHMTHDVEMGAGHWWPVSTNGYWRMDTARAPIFPPPWSEGALQWNVPMAWGYSYAGENPELRREVQPSPTAVQIYTINSWGTVTIEKSGHLIERNVFNYIWLDGVLVN